MREQKRIDSKSKFWQINMLSPRELISITRRINFVKRKDMRTVFLIVTIASLTANVWAQEPKVKTDTFKVEGVCGMCEDRIEEVVNLSKGVKSCSWNKETTMLSVTYKTKHTSVEDIGKSLASAGHDNEYAKATEKEYSKIHKCCRYREMEGH